MQLLFYKNGDWSDKEFERSFKYGFMYVEAFLSAVKLDILTWLHWIVQDWRWFPDQINNRQKFGKIASYPETWNPFLSEACKFWLRS